MDDDRMLPLVEQHTIFSVKRCKVALVVFPAHPVMKHCPPRWMTTRPDLLWADDGETLTIRNYDDLSEGEKVALFEDCVKSRTWGGPGWATERKTTTN